MPRLQSPYRWEALVPILRSEQFLGVTQETLARKLGVTVFTVSKWERGVAQPVMKARVKLKALAISVGYSEEQWPRVTKPMTVLQSVKS